MKFPVRDFFKRYSSNITFKILIGKIYFEYGLLWRIVRTYPKLVKLVRKHGSRVICKVMLNNYHVYINRDKVTIVVLNLEYRI